MPSLSNWLDRRAASAPVPGSALNITASTYYSQSKDPNAPDHRLQIASKCIYERQMPGGSYITAHIERLQSGYYDSPVVHEDCIPNVRFVALRFVFHEASTERRFKAATIRISLLDGRLQPDGIALPPQIDHPDDDVPPAEKLRPKPKFLRYSPHLLYGAMSPENLDWNFNLAGALGTTQAPVSASVNPSYGIKSSYKIYKMMKIQGSLRTNSSWHGKYYDIDDGELVWTLEENELQKSGLPREFTFVMMLTKGDNTNHVSFEVDIEPEVASWFGSYPQWWVHLLKYQPLHKDPLDLDVEVGQRFAPCDRMSGYNFAGMMSTFDKFVSMPGTMYSPHDWSVTDAPPPTTNAASGGQQKQQNQTSIITQSPTQMKAGDEATASNTLHLRIHLDQAHRHEHAIPASASHTSPDPASTSASTAARTAKQQQFPPTRQSSLPASTTPSTKPATKPDSTSKQPITITATTTRATGPISRRLTIDGTTAKPTPPKYKLSRVPPLQTHFEEHTPSPPKPRTLSSEEEEGESDQDYDYSFPEQLHTTTKTAGQSTSSPGSNHRHSKSTSSSSTTSMLLKTSPPRTGPTQYQNQSPPQKPTQIQPQHSLRRTRSRSSLRRSISLSSTPEDEEAISAAMDMLQTGTPPPPSVPAPPASAPPTLPPSTTYRPKPIYNDHENDEDKEDEEPILATPKTRAALADLLEVERAEKARIQRRNGNVPVQEGYTTRRPDHVRARDDSSMRDGYSRINSNVNGDARSHSTGGGGGGGGGIQYSTASDQDRRRQTRYSMPVMSSGIGYAGGNRNGNESRGYTDASISTAVAADVGSLSRGPDIGHGRSSLMIPIGSKRDNGLGIGIASSTPEITTNTNVNVDAGFGAGRPGSSRRDGGLSAYSGHVYV